MLLLLWHLLLFVGLHNQIQQDVTQYFSPAIFADFHSLHEQYAVYTRQYKVSMKFEFK